MRKRIILLTAAFGLLAFTAMASAAAPSDRSAGIPLGTSFPRYEVPNGGHAEGVGTYHVKFFRADGSLYATRDRDGANSFDLDTRFYNSNGDEYASVHALMPSKPRRHNGSVKRTNAICGSGAYADLGVRLLGGGYNWYWYPPNPALIGHSGGSTNNILTAVRNARGEWNTVNDWCTVPDNSALAMNYQGVYPTNAGVFDGVNFFAFHTDAYLTPLSCGHTVAIACTFNWVGSPPYLAESDTALNLYWGWDLDPLGGACDTGTPYYCDVQGVTAHESGHTMGLAHVSGAQNVMGTANDNQGYKSNRKLGLGDANADNLWY